MGTMKKLIDGRAVADTLGIPEHTLANWRWRGVGPPYLKVGKHVRYDPDQLEAWVAQQSRGGSAGAA
jgi:hypothetical protein